MSSHGAHTALLALLLSGAATHGLLVDGATPICSPPPPGLISWWPAEGDPSNVHGGNHGIALGGVAYAPGMVGLAFAFNGVDSYVQIVNEEPFDFGAGPFPIATCRPWHLSAGKRR